MELEAEQQEHECRRHDQDGLQAGERLLLRPVTSRQLPAVARGEFELRQLFLQLAIDRAQVALFELGGDRDDRLLVFPRELVGAADGADRGELAERDEADPGRRRAGAAERTASRSPG